MGRSPDVAEILRQHNLRVTPQRRAILEAFRGTQAEHLSAEEVFLSCASIAIPEIGRGTVYSALAEMTELGALASVGTAAPVRYETNTAPHDHFYCRLCMRLFDVELGGDGARMRPPDGYEVETVTVRADGVCRECRDYRRGLTDGAQAIRSRPTLEPADLDGLSCAVAESAIGQLGLVASARGIVRIAFADHADFEAIATDAAESGRAKPRLRDLGAALRRYLAGSAERLTNAIDWGSIDEATSQTLQRVGEIPFGQGRSYVELGSTLTAYDCGRTMGTNPLPLLIPCHRVRCGSARPQVYVGGSERLRFLERLEAPS